MLDQHIEENYEKFVRDGVRTYEEIAEQATKDGSPALAEWARKRAEGAEPAEAHEAANDSEPKGPYEGLSVKELKEIAGKRPEIELKSTDLKEDIVEKLIAADERKGGQSDIPAS
ncbi:hypothetical protein [Herbiconiux sp. VKM Ac-2851]|uniref:hypothetical protein n=1 Tax=Herbiconiux sp. VKM Ac-2851 TaxID=2739025 RepID=UPI0015677FA3|nr:hypothetical protein [Herbiconiux sp. VKM Ac-2851]NQX36255.1 hypothetical protein [Herbiconiux sp. VKM Ac-2851]